MNTRHLMFGARVTGILFVFAALPGQSAAEIPPDHATKSVAYDANEIISGLQQVARDLTDAVRSFQTHLDREIALHDNGYRVKDGRRIPGADVDLTSGPADVMQTATRKLFAARMISARRPGYEPVPLADSDRIQILIEEARRRIQKSNDLMRRSLMVSASELSSQEDAKWRMRRGELLKARTAAAEAAKKALVALPVGLPEADSPEEQREKAWDLMTTSFTIGKKGGSDGSGMPPQTTSADPMVLPIRLEQGKRITLILGPFRRVALTDSGTEDGKGRRLFYQDEWIQLRRITMALRWAVAVDTVTGHHTLLRRYAPHEYPGDMNDIYHSPGRDYLTLAELKEITPPSMPDLTSARVRVGSVQEELRSALLDLKGRIREALARSNASLTAQNKLPLDDELPNDLREKLFAIRAHMAGTPAILDTENALRKAIEQAAGSVQTLEVLVAWFNAAAIEQESPAQDPRALLEALNRSDAEIDRMRSLESEAMAALPPDLSVPDAEFPALKKDFIVRIRRVPAAAGKDATFRCKQEVWRVERALQGRRHVKRTIVFLDVEPRTGSQIPSGREVKYYLVGDGDTLEGIYDENAAQ